MVSPFRIADGALQMDVWVHSVAHSNSSIFCNRFNTSIQLNIITSFHKSVLITQSFNVIYLNSSVFVVWCVVLSNNLVDCSVLQYVVISVVISSNIASPYNIRLLHYSVVL